MALKNDRQIPRSPMLPRGGGVGKVKRANMVDVFIGRWSVRREGRVRVVRRMVLVGR